MTPNLSSLADTASGFYRGRAQVTAFADNCGMSDEAWRERLRAGLAASGKSMRSVSLATGNGPGYVSSILTEGKDPTIENLIAVCDAIPISLAFVLYGFDITPEDADLLAAMKESPETRDAVLTLLRSRAK